MEPLKICVRARCAVFVELGLVTTVPDAKVNEGGR